MSRSIRALNGVLLLLASVGALVACGSPQFTYVKNSGDRTYFKVPANWHKIDAKPIDPAVTGDTPDSAAAAARGMWSVAYDADARPSADHMLISEEPIVYAGVYQLTKDEHDAYSLDKLRDSFLPVTDSSRQLVAQRAQAQGTPVPKLERLYDQELTPGDGLRGVREVYNYDLSIGGMQTYDLTAYLSDQGQVYVLLLHCSARCYRNRVKEINSIATSFTVRKNL
ncbi:MAG TPA: hypothetical protein VF069_03160 [Streptosporangiaceae bacterium]